jgi:predicted alpha/beta superfamily hydrolase
MRPTPLAPSLHAALAVALAVAAPTAALAQAASVRVVELESKAFGGKRALTVRLPPGHERGAERYPVLYLTDGDRHLASLDATIRFLVQSGRMPEVIVVGIPHGDRTRELTPTRAGMPRPDGTVEVLPTSGGADALLAFLEQEAVPWVEANLRAAPMRILAGHSFGGLFALYTLAARPELFQARIAVAPTFHWDGSWPVRRIADLVAKRPDVSGALVFTMGDEGPAMAAGFADLQKALAGATRLRSRGFHFPDEDHGSVVFPSHYAALREIFAGYRMPVADGAVGPAGGLAAVEAHFRTLSERLGYDVPVPEAVLNLAGYQQLREKNVEQAIRAFRRNVELHPASANPHDSLGEAYEQAGDLPRARDSYRKAWTIGDATKDPNTALFKANHERVRAALAKPRS